jgi:GNAT superfamily N-acetyltransferase
MDVDLASALPADAPRVAEIWRAGWHEAHDGRVPEELVAVRTAESFEQRAAELLERTTVARLAGTVAGFTMVHGDEVEQVYVDPAYRGGGVADLLLSAAEQRIAADGHRAAWLAVVAGNTRARRFYEKRGWRDDGPFEHRAPGPRGPVSVPAHRYRKQFGPSPGPGPRRAHG